MVQSVVVAAPKRGRGVQKRGVHAPRGRVLSEIEGRRGENNRDSRLRVEGNESKRNGVTNKKGTRSIKDETTHGDVDGALSGSYATHGKIGAD